MADRGPHWFPLFEAFWQFADPETRSGYDAAAVAYAEVYRGTSRYLDWMDDPRAWLDVPLPRPGILSSHIEAHARVAGVMDKLQRAFFARLSSGELICRARPTAPWEPWWNVPAHDWKVIEVENWKTGTLAVRGTNQRLFLAEVAKTPAAEATRDGLPAALAEAPPVSSPPAGVRSTRAVNRAAVRRWYADEWIPERSESKRPPSRDDDFRAARGRFPGVTQRFVRDLRKELAPEEWRRPGQKARKPQ